MQRRPLVLASIAAGSMLLAAVAASAGATGGAPDYSDPAVYTAQSQHDEVLNILPPGSRGNVDATDLASLGVTNLPKTLTDLPGIFGNPSSAPSRTQSDLATATPTTPANFADQWEMYDSLNRANLGRLTDGDLLDYYKDAPLGVDPADVVSTETLTSPDGGTVTIKRDKFGVPHIFGSTDEATAYGSGYANIEDRMFLTDVLRHTGAANMAEFVGPTPGNIAMDQAQLRIAPYTPAEATQQVQAIFQRYPEAQPLRSALDGFLSGMNDAQKALCPGAFGLPVPGSPGVGFGPKCPVEYAALQKAPTPYQASDLVYIASLVGGIFGKGGGGEFSNGIWLQQLAQKYGMATAEQIFNDLREKNDPEAPTTSPFTQTYGGGGVDPTKPGVALPDLHPKATAPGTGSLQSSNGSLSATGPATPASWHYGVVDTPEGPIDLGLSQPHMSNALLVDAKHSASGHPTVVFGPQTGYYTPQLLVEQDLEGPDVHARGVSFAGTNIVVELGRGIDYAWSATSASNDLVDTVMEKLCNLDGSPATVNSTSYLVGKACVPMQSYTHTETALPNVTATSQPQTLNFLVLKTRHGVVQDRTTVGGIPVAVVTERSTYNHELDSAWGFHLLNDPNFVHDAKSFQQAVSKIDYTFNWFYVDSKDIAYYSSGLLPERSSLVDWDLPRWGDNPAYDWASDVDYDNNGSPVRFVASHYLGFDAHPRVIDPPTGFLVSWNNKTAPGFSAADNDWGDGAVYRSLALSDRVKKDMTDGTKVTRASLVADMMDAATVDVRAFYTLPEVLGVIGTKGLDPQDAEAVRLLQAWEASGAHRADPAQNGHYDQQAAIDLMDVWWQPSAAGISGNPSFSLPKDVLRGTLGSLVDALPQGLDDHPRQHIGSSWNGVAWYGYVNKDLRQILGDPVQGRYSRTYCGGGSLAACQAQLRASLHAAVQAAMAAEGVPSVDQLTYDKANDDIVPVTAGVVGVRPIDWQNRPTFQQVVSFTSHR
jgi:acyl-homoserine lactone acylase PvdQ